MDAIPCTVGSTCDEVAKLQISHPFGIPLTMVGICIAIANLINIISGNRVKAIPILVAITGILSISMQAYIRIGMGLNCIWCTISAASFVASSIMSFSFSMTNSRRTVYPNLSIFSIACSFIFLMAIRMGFHRTIPPRSFNSSESRRLFDASGNHRFVVFSCVTCPACQSLYLQLLKSPVINNTKLIYFDVHRSKDTFALQSHFDQLIKEKKFTDAGKFVSMVSTGSAPRVPSPPEAVIQYFVGQQTLATDLKISGTPTIVELEGPTRAHTISVNQFLRY